MSAQWYPRYAGDYMRDTRHLTLIEHGAYTLLLDHYYATGRPLDAELSALYRVCGAQGDDERAAIAAVADQFFPVNGDGLRHNKRADTEIERAHAISNKRSTAGKIGAVSTWQGKRKAKAMANALASATTTTSTSTSIPQPQIPPIPPAGGIGDFDAFWNAYPRRIGKKAALKAWGRAKDKPPVSDIIAAIESQRESEQWRRDGGQYIPHPATWINQGRWDDKPIIRQQLGLGGISPE